MTGVSTLTFDDLVAPTGAQGFMRDVVGKQPMHFPAQGEGRRLIDWARMNALLAIESHWSDAYLKLVINGMPVGKDRYCDMVQSLYGPEWRADPAKVQAFMALGASIVANMVDEVAPELRAVGETIGERMGGVISANIYSSFKDIGGFGPHYDTSDVLAFQCEGEKVWRIYEGRADNPLHTPTGPDHEVLAQLRQAAGRQIGEMVMRPGDALYMPRGFYHDAMTRSEASLHVTFAIMPLNGRLLLRALEQAALEESAFRAYVPDASDEAAFRAHAEKLGQRLKDLATSPGVLAEMRKRQQELRKPVSAYALPGRGNVRVFRTTGRKIEISGNPPMIRAAGAGEMPVGPFAEVATWAGSANGITDLELYARFKTLPRADLDRFLDGLVRIGAFTPL